MSKAMSRMSDVARLARVSSMTVSRVLTGNEKVSPELRDRVLAAVADLKYRPNELARSLRDRRSRQIGVIVPYLFDPFFAICAHAVSEVAKSHSYSVVLSTSNEDSRTEYDEVCKMLRRNVEGMVIIPAAGSTPGDSPLLRPEVRQCHIIMADRPVDRRSFDTVLVDNVGGAQRGTEHLLSLGHKRIAFVSFEQNMYTLQARYEGYQTAMLAAGLRPVRVSFSAASDDFATHVRKLLAARYPPTAVLCGNNLITRHLLHGLKASGFVPPTPLAVVGFDDFETADLLEPGITVIRQPVEEIGRQAAEILFERLAGKHPQKKREVVLDVDLVLRGSCGRLQVGQRFSSGS